MIHQELTKKLKELEIDYEDADIDTKEQIQERIEECIHLIKTNEPLLREENKNNEYE